MTRFVLGCLLLTVAWIQAWAAAPTTTTLTVNPATSIAFQHPVQLVATVKDGAGNPVRLGTVTFYADKAILGTVHLVGNGNNGLTLGSTTLWTRLLTVGPHSLTAAYNGTTADAPSTSAAQSFAVTNAAGLYPTTTVLSSTGNTDGQYGLTANVGGFGPAFPSGSVTINDKTTGSALGTGDLSGASSALLELSTIPDLCPSSMVSGDFNNDGIQDLVIESNCSGTSPVLQALLGMGDGTFSPGPTLLSSGGSIVAADFNGDGNLDLYDGNNIYLGNGDGSFGPSGSAAPAAVAGSTVAVGDLNGDGIPDLVAGVVGNSSSVTVYLGKGDGTFDAGTIIPFSVDPTQFQGGYNGGEAVYPVTSVAVGDLNHDGMDDVVVNAGMELFVFLSTGNVAAPSIQSYPNGDYFTYQKVMEGVMQVSGGETASSVSLVDFSRGGNLDAVIGSFGFGAGQDQITVLPGNGTGSFPINYTFFSIGASSDLQISVGDYNYDGKLDVLAYSSGLPPTLFPGDGVGDIESGVASSELTSGSARSIGATFIASDLLNDGSNDPVLITVNPAPYYNSVSILHSANTSAVSLSNVTVPGQGPQIVTASYAGDSNYAASTSKQINLDTRPPVAVELSSSSSSVFPGYPVTITASVVVPRGGAVPTGTIQFYNGSTALGSPVPLSGGNASDAVTFATLGTQEVTAAYSGDSNYQPASSTIGIGVVTSVKPALALSSGSVQQYGAPVAITVLLQTTIPGPAPTGTVSLTFDGTALGQDVLSGNPPFSLPFTWNPPTPPGIAVHYVTASYSGDASWSATSSTFNITVQGTTVLSIAYGGSATVSSGVPLVVTGQLTTAESGPPLNGTIALLDSGTPIATVTLVGATPPFVPSFTVNSTAQPLSAGNHLFSLQFSGPPGTYPYWQSSTSSNLSVTVNGASVVALSSNLPSSLVALTGATVQFTAHLAPLGSAAIPTGTVQFYDGSTQIGAPVSVLNGTAAFTSTAFVAGPHSVTANYSGDTNYAASTAAAVLFTVTAKGTTTVAPSIGGLVFRGTAYQIPVTIQEAPLALGPMPTGTVTLLNAAGTTIASATVAAGGGATMLPLDPMSANMALGSNTITAQYLGDNSWNGSVSSPVSFKVVMGQPVFTNFSCGAISTIAVATPVTCMATFTASLTVNDPTPTNPVNLLDNGVAIASQVLVGTTDFPISFQINTSAKSLSAGPHTLSMNFAQDANWLSATSSTTTLTVNGNVPTFILTSNLGNYSSVVQGTMITFSATATGTTGTPTGSVQFYVDGTPGGAAVEMNRGVAIYSTTTLTSATHQVTAAYSGDSIYHSTTTNGIVSVVTQGPDLLSMAVQGPVSVNSGTQISITGSLAVGALGPPPTGTVSLLDGNSVMATKSLTANGQATVAFNVNTPTAPLSSGNHSFSLAYAGEAHWVASASATATVNVINTTAPPPTFSPAGGTYTSAQTVTISAAVPGATIYYTTNGTTPTTTSTTYSGPITVSSTETIEAIATASGYSASPVAVATYTLKTTPTVTVSPSATSITTAQALSVTVTVSGAAGKPTPTGAVTLTSGAYTSSATTLNAGGATISIPAGSLSTGNDTLTVVYLGDSNYGTATGTASISVNPFPSFTLSVSPANVSIVRGVNGTSTITVTAIGGFSGDVSLSASGLPNGVTASFAAGSAAETQVLTLAANTSAAVTSTSVTVTITGTSGTLSTTTSLSLTIAAQSGFMPGNGGTTSITVAHGATTGNTGTISVVGTSGFSGTVNLACKTTTSMSNVNDMPTCSLSPLSVNIQGATAQTSTLTINTTAATTANNQLKKVFWPSAGDATLALLMFFTLPKRRNWLAILGVLVLFVSWGTLGCGGGGSSQGGGGVGNSGTTVGSYTITVTGTSGTLSVTVGTVTLTVQ